MTGVDKSRRIPRATDGHGRLAFHEPLAHDVGGDRRGLETLGDHVLIPLAGSDGAGVTNADLGRIVAAGVVAAEDVAAKGGLNRIEVVRVAFHADEAVLIGLNVVGIVGRQFGRDVVHFGPRRRALGHQVGVDEQGDVLGGVGHAVQLAVIGEGFDGRRSEFADPVAQIDGNQDTAGHQLPQPVVGADDDVGSFAGRPGGDDVGADGAEVKLFDEELDTVLFLKGRLDSFEHRGACFVGPDADDRRAFGRQLLAQDRIGDRRRNLDGIDDLDDAVGGLHVGRGDVELGRVERLAGLGGNPPIRHVGGQLGAVHHVVIQGISQIAGRVGHQPFEHRRVHRLESGVGGSKERDRSIGRRFFEPCRGPSFNKRAEVGVGGQQFGDRLAGVAHDAHGLFGGGFFGRGFGRFFGWSLGGFFGRGLGRLFSRGLGGLFGRGLCWGSFLCPAATGRHHKGAEQQHYYKQVPLGISHHSPHI